MSRRGRKEEDTEKMDIYQKTEIGYCDHVAPFNLHPQPISPKRSIHSISLNRRGYTTMLWASDVERKLAKEGKEKLLKNLSDSLVFWWWHFDK